jgi:hypothetical protein
MRGLHALDICVCVVGKTFGRLVQLFRAKMKTEIIPRSVVNFLKRFIIGIILSQKKIEEQIRDCNDTSSGLTTYLANETGPVPLVLDLRIDHDRVGSSSDPTLNGHLKYPNNLDQSLNDATPDKIRKYRADYNNRSPSVVSFMPVIASTSDRLHSEFVRLLFLQSHRETDRFFTVSGVQSEQSTSGHFHFRRASFSAQLKSKLVLTLTEETVLRINLNVDGDPITSKSHTQPSHSETSRLLTSSLSLGVKDYYQD